MLNMPNVRNLLGTLFPNTFIVERLVRGCTLSLFSRLHVSNKVARLVSFNYCRLTGILQYAILFIEVEVNVVVVGGSRQ